MESNLFYEEYLPEAHELTFGVEFDVCRDTLHAGAAYMQSVLVSDSRAPTDLTMISLLRTFVVHGKAALEDLRHGLLEPAAAHMRTLMEARLVQLYFIEEPSETSLRVGRYLVALSGSEQRHLEQVLKSGVSSPANAKRAREGARFWKDFTSSQNFSEAKEWVKNHDGAWHPHRSLSGLAKHFSDELSYEQKFREFSSYGAHVAHPLLHLTAEDGKPKIRAAAQAETTEIDNAVSILVPLLFQSIGDAMIHFDSEDQRLGVLPSLRQRVGECLQRSVQRKRGRVAVE